MENSTSEEDSKYYTISITALSDSAPKSVAWTKAASQLFLESNQGGLSTIALLARARGDYQRILNAFYAQGYYGGVIHILINGVEASTLNFAEALPVRSTIEIKVDAGSPYLFGQARVSPLPQVAIGREKPQASLNTIGFQTGHPAQSTTVLKAEKIAIMAWQQRSYAKAKIEKSEIIADHALKQLDAKIFVAPGRQAIYGPLAVQNISILPRMNSAFVTWMTGIVEGRPYKPDDIARANQRLQRLDVFRVATVREGAVIDQEGYLPLSLILEERKPRRIGMGAKYSTLDGGGIAGFLLHRNLFGRAEALRFDAEMSGVGSRGSRDYDWKNFNYLLSSKFTKPGIYTPDTNLVAQVKAEHEVVDQYRATSIHGRVGVNQQFNPQLAAHITTDLSYISNEDKVFGKREFQLFGLEGGLLYDGRDDKNDAKSGFYSEVTATPLYQWDKGKALMRLNVEGRTYFSFDEKKRFILALRAKSGTLLGDKIEGLPMNMLFFAGGGGSVRGYAYRNIGVNLADGSVVGGHSLLEGSAEVRAMVTDTIGVVGFVDGGLVGEKPYPDFLQSPKWGAGVGVRYQTGFGPLRADIALPFNRDKGDPRFGFYIGIGQAF
ncbi:autotransporter assembly complex protein TamA [Bartonella sp. DGB2]|uniref:autotransporter assembly complex protein TamA n=1 Tax=Bartonella sp. DGB2 TaxID=3388426 RepID=UPI00399017E1